jgi:hypothetical protein
MNSQSPQNYTPGLPPAFLDLERRLAGLRDQYERGELNDQVYQAGVQALTVKDDSGTTWWLSGEAGAWQRWDGQRWVRDPKRYSESAIFAPWRWGVVWEFYWSVSSPVCCSLEVGANTS